MYVCVRESAAKVALSLQMAKKYARFFDVFERFHKMIPALSEK